MRQHASVLSAHFLLLLALISAAVVHQGVLLLAVQTESYRSEFGSAFARVPQSFLDIQDKRPRNSKIDAVVTIAAGSYSPIRLITGLRRYGNFDGPVYVLSDNADGLHGRNWTSLTRDVFPVPFDAIPPPKSDPKKATERFLRRDDPGRIMWYKTQLYEAINASTGTSIRGNSTGTAPGGKSEGNSTHATDIDATAINKVLFMDSDIQVKACLKSLEDFLQLDDAGNDIGRPRCSAYFFPERYYVEENFNAGLAVFDKRTDGTTALLRDWSEEILSGRWKNDQVALDALVRSGKYNVCALPKRMNYFTTDLLTLAINTLALGRRKRRAVFLHPTAGKDLRAMARPDDGTLEKSELQWKKFFRRVKRILIRREY